jgi:tetratricopeptide (TPR) repeat protein
MMKSAWLVIFVFLLSLGSCKFAKKEQAGDKAVNDPVKTSLDELNRQIAGNASDPDLYNKRAGIYLLDKDFDKAFKDINSAISLSPSNPVYYLTLSDIYLLQGQTKNCSESLLKALSLDPKNNEALLKLAKLNLIIKEYPATFVYVKKALNADPVNPKAYFIRAIALLEKGDTVRAAEDLQKAVDQDQQFFDAYLELGELYSIKKDKMAADYLRNALNIRPKSKEALYLLGMFYQENNQFDKALETYTILGKIDTTLKNVPYNTGYIYLVYMNDFRQAALYFSRAIQKDPGYAEAYYNRGYAYELSGQYDKAYSDYKMTLKLKTNYQKAIDGLNRLDRIRQKAMK